jgi:hypothetical protein
VCAREWRERESCNGSSLAAIAAAGNPNNWYQSTWFKGVFDFAQK